MDEAPGAPGIPPTWCSSAKETVGCGLQTGRIWFTIGGGIVNEVYYPRADLPQIRDLGFIVADDAGFWVEVKRLGEHVLRAPAPGIPAVEIAHRHPRFVLHVRVTPDPRRDVLLVALRLAGDASLRVYALLAPHLGGTGHDNFAEAATYRDRRVLWAEQGPFGLALAAADADHRDAWRRTSAGYVGRSDGWQDFHANGAMRWTYPLARHGNVALMGELPRESVLALAFGTSKEAAATLAMSSLAGTFDEAWSEQVAAWHAWQEDCARALALPDTVQARLRDQARISAMVLRTHQDKTYPGAMVASLSVPWGNTRDERGGYHLVWPRDLVECAGALLELGSLPEARDILRYLVATQYPDGHWSQNQWLGGRPYWGGVQLDEAAFPVLLAARLADRDALAGIAVGDMVRRALGFIARTGPSSDQDRWEEDAGISTFTAAVCIAALVCGARWLDRHSRAVALRLADYWNARIEDWTVARDTALARECGVSSYYVRIAPADALIDDRALSSVLPIRNRATGADVPANEQVGTDFLQLVRFGLRRADDPVVRDTLKVVDRLLATHTPAGPAWHRYTGDGYGEHDDGAPFDGVGCGRAWPLLTGERGHYAVAAGEDPLPCLDAMAAMCGDGGMMPEQVWDAAPVPARNLFPGRPSGSSMPLAWAHAEFLKLLVSRQSGQPCDRPEAVWARYRGKRPGVGHVFWLPQSMVTRMPEGADLCVGLSVPAVLHVGVDDWRDVTDVATRPTTLGLHFARLRGNRWSAGQVVRFTYHDGNGHWAGRDFAIEVTPGAPPGRG
ncbi:MAG: glycosyl hydrolase [Betaproteobacteria bacterium]|nr:glycosyl hydrolase [Betaproteobacteria bacterium]